MKTLAAQGGSNPSVNGLLAAVRQRRWSAYVPAEAEEAELAAIRRSSATGLPYGEAGWLNRLAAQRKLDLTVRPRGRPRKDRSKTEK